MSPPQNSVDFADVEATVAPQALFAEVRGTAVHLAELLQPLRLTQPDTLPALWAEYIAAVQEVVHLLDTGGTSSPYKGRCPPMSLKQRRDFGLLLRKRRNAAGLSRQQLARKAQLSAATIKFIETARHSPSRTSLVRIINVPELLLRWADVPGQPLPLIAASAEHSMAYQGSNATAGHSFTVLNRLDFDELGDPVFVRRILVARSSLSGATSPKHDQEPPAQDAYAVIDFLPMRRCCP